MEATEAIAKAVLVEDQAHEGTGLNERAYGIHAILEKFRPPPEGVAEPKATYDAGGKGEPKLTLLQEAAVAIDELYASDETAPTYWQDKRQMKKDLRATVRRLVRGLKLEGWAKQVPLAVEQYAVAHYRKP